MVGELKAALEDCNEALRLKPNSPSALDHRGLAYLKLGQPDEAIVDYDEALKLNPDSPEALFGRGVAKLMKGDIFASTADLAAAQRKEAEHRGGVREGRRSRPAEAAVLTPAKSRRWREGRPGSAGPLPFRPEAPLRTAAECGQLP